MNSTYTSFSMDIIVYIEGESKQNAVNIMYV